MMRQNRGQSYSQLKAVEYSLLPQGGQNARQGHVQPLLIFVLREKFQPYLQENELFLPPPGERPYWEPTILDFCNMEEMIKAEKKHYSQPTPKDLASRTDVMNYMLGRDVLCTYHNWAWSRDIQEGILAQPKCPEHIKFYRDLLAEIETNRREVLDEGERLKARAGRRIHDVGVRESG